MIKSRGNIDLRFMRNCLIELTLLRNSRQIKIDPRKILTYKTIIFGAGSIMSLTEKLDGSNTVLVNESTDQIEALLLNINYMK